MCAHLCSVGPNAANVIKQEEGEGEGRDVNKGRSGGALVHLLLTKTSITVDELKNAA